MLQQLPERLAYDLRLLTDLPVPKAYGDDATAQQVILLLSIVSVLIRVAAGAHQPQRIPQLQRSKSPGCTVPLDVPDETCSQRNGGRVATARVGVERLALIDEVFVRSFSPPWVESVIAARRRMGAVFLGLNAVF